MTLYIASLLGGFLQGSNRVSGWWAAEPPRGRRAELFLGIWRYARTRRRQDSRTAFPGRCPGAAAARSAAATRCLPWNNVDFTEAVTILIPSILAPAMVNRLMTEAP